MRLFSIYCEGSASIGIILSTTCRVHWTSFSPTICSELSLCCSTLTLPTKLPANHPDSLHVHTWTETQHQSQWQISDSCWDAWRISGVWLDKFFFLNLLTTDCELRFCGWTNYKKTPLRTDFSRFSKSFDNMYCRRWNICNFMLRNIIPQFVDAVILAIKCFSTWFFLVSLTFPIFC